MLIRDKLDHTNQDAYLGNGNSDENPVLNFFAYFLLLNTMIPISLVITLEIIKVVQCYFISVDAQMYSLEDAAGCHVSTTTINEELGQVTYVFSDKTGTLTQNMMEFKSLCVENEIYGSIGEQINRKPSRIELKSEIEFTFHSKKLDNVLDNDLGAKGESLTIRSKNGEDSLTLENDREKAIEVIKLLALCHE